MRPMPMPVPMRVPNLGQPRGPTPEEAAQMQVLQNINQLSLGMYAQLAVAYLSRIDSVTPSRNDAPVVETMVETMVETIDAEPLKRMAHNCRIAAKAYFEAFGVTTSAVKQ